jgi:hypothetical protein
MKRLTAFALLLAAFGALMHFWPSEDASSPGSSAPVNPAPGEPRAAPSTPSAASPSLSGASSPSAQTSAATAAEHPAAPPARIDVRAPQTVPSGQTFSVTIEVQAPLQYAGSRSL